MDEQKKFFKTKVTLVTGASRGIGKATALALGEQGASVAIIAKNLQALNLVKRSFEEMNVPCLVLQCDVSHSDKLEQAIDEVEKILGPIDILVNNAGIYKTAPVQGHSLGLWRDIFEVNLNAAMLASRQVLNNMVERQWGRIINISSLSGRAGEAYASAYSASKFAMLGLTQSLALEVARHNITVNAICPGWVKTDLTFSQLQDEDWCELSEIDPSESIEIARLSVPQMRFIDPEEVAQLVIYLASHEARGITGQAINICGGLSLH